MPHLRDIAVGAKSKIASKEVQVILVPYYEGLSIEKMLEFAAGKDAVMKALPDLERERLRLPREYIANVIYTLVGDKFKDWVTSRIQARNSYLAEKNAQLIPLDPDIGAIFKQSTDISGKYKEIRFKL